MKKIIASVMAIALTASLAACGSKETPATPTTPSQKTFKVALVADGAGLGSQSFNDVALEGLEKAKADFGIELTTLEVKEAADLANSLRSLAQQGIDLIVTPSSSIKDAVTEVSKEYPDTYFGLLDIQVEGLNNVISSSYREHESAFLLGALGASISKTKQIGYVGGISGVIQNRFQYGFMAGANHIDPSVGVKVSYVGSFSDVGKGKEIAAIMYSDGADFIATAAGAGNLGVFQAAVEAGAEKYAFGAANGQFHLMPEEIIASQVKRVDNVAYSIVKSLVEGTIKGGTKTEYGLKDGGVDLYYTSNEALLKLIPEETKAKIEELRKGINDGTIAVPNDEATYNSFKK